MNFAGKRQESITFLQRSFFNDAVQFVVCCSPAFGKKTMSAMQNSECCSAVSALQLSENCSATSVFRLWHLGLAEVSEKRLRRFQFRFRFLEQFEARSDGSDFRFWFGSCAILSESRRVQTSRETCLRPRKRERLSAQEGTDLGCTPISKGSYGNTRL